MLHKYQVTDIAFDIIHGYGGTTVLYSSESIKQLSKYRLFKKLQFWNGLKPSGKISLVFGFVPHTSTERFFFLIYDLEELNLKCYFWCLPVIFRGVTYRT
jgi:hypothetical protein